MEPPPDDADFYPDLCLPVGLFAAMRPLSAVGRLFANNAFEWVPVAACISYKREVVSTVRCCVVEV